jgi:hypothetical protein
MKHLKLIQGQGHGETLSEFYIRTGLSSSIRREVLDSIRCGKNPNLDTIFAVDLSPREVAGIEGP